MAELRVLGVVPARGGSKGIPRKNLHPLGGKPLLQYTLDAARASRRLTHVVVLTEDPEIGAVAAKLRTRVIERPPELASDEAPTLPVIQHAVAAMEKEGRPFDYVFTLQATTPFRTADDIDRAIELAAQTGAESIIGVVRVYDTHPARIKRIENGRLADYFPEDEHSRRQDLPPAYLRNGAVYLTRRDVLARGALKGTDQVPFEMPQNRSINIDEPIDFLVAEAMLRQLC